MMKIVIPGGSGHLGTVLARAFHRDAHEVVVLSRWPAAQPWRVIVWDGVSLGEWQREVDGCDAVINLAGRSVNCRYTAEHRDEILQSRVLSTSVVGRAIHRASRPPRLWLQASTATIYSHRFDGPNDERSGVLGGDESNAPEAWRFSIDVALAWERCFHNAITPGTRKVALRSAVALIPDTGGVLDILIGLARRGLGGKAGDGRQYVSWIHYADFVSAVRWLLDRDDFDGVVNVAAPQPVTNSEFMRVLRKACGASFGLPTPKWMLEVGAVFMRTETELVLKSRRVIPARLLESGFRFEYPTWEAAALDLCREWSKRRARELKAA
jgi:uncharacterized protein